MAVLGEEDQTVLERLRKTVREAAPEATEAMRYGIPTFRLRGKNLVHMVAFTGHYSFFPTPSGVEAFRKELTGYKTAKGTIQFPKDKPVPYDLVRKIVEFRVRQVSGA